MSLKSGYTGINVTLEEIKAVTEVISCLEKPVGSQTFLPLIRTDTKPFREAVFSGDGMMIGKRTSNSASRSGSNHGPDLQALIS